MQDALLEFETQGEKVKPEHDGPLSEPLQEVPSGRGAASPKKPKATRAKRDYKGELQDLQSRVDTALRIMKKSTESEANSPAAKQLTAIAIETLEGDS
jgi:hypothetical protein